MIKRIIFFFFPRGPIVDNNPITYEDATDIDSVGIVTARSGVKVGAHAGVGLTIFSDGSINSSGMVFPGQQHSLQINAGDMSNYYGLQCASGVSGTVTVLLATRVPVNLRYKFLPLDVAP